MYLVVIRFSDPGAGRDAAVMLADAGGLDPSDTPVVASPSGTQLVAFVTDDRLEDVRREIMRRGGTVVYEEQRDAREWRRFRAAATDQPLGAGDATGTERVRVLAENSDRLLEALARLRDIEEEKREEDIGSPRFRALAEEVERLASEVAERARVQRSGGEKLAPRDQTIEDVGRGA